MIDNKSPFSPALSAFRVWQALEPSEVVSAIPIDSALEPFEAAIARGNNSADEMLRAQAIGLHITACRLLEMAADASEEWQQFSSLIDLALRAQDQCRQSLEFAHRLNGGKNGQP